MPWVALLLLVASSASAQEPVKADRLFEAVMAKNISVVKDALDKGAEVEARNKDGRTPLMVAARYPTIPEIVSLLLEKGAEVNARNNAGWTPLMRAARYSTIPEIVTLLLDAGADALAKDEDGKRAIDHAKENFKLEGTKAYWKLHDRSFE